MIKTIIKGIYSAFISIVLISILLVGSTGYAFISQSSKSSEIINVVHDMYTSQKFVVIDVIDLFKILIRKEISESILNENSDFLSEKKLNTDLEDDSDSDKLSIVEDNGDNPLGIVIEPSFPIESDDKLSVVTEEPLTNESSMKQMEIELGMDMN